MAEILAGSTASIGLVSLLQLTEAEGCTGFLRIGDAEIRLHRGGVVGASFNGVEGVDALLELMLHAGASFVLNDDPVPAGQPVGELGPLLLDGCRLLDDWSRVDRKVVRPLRRLPDSLKIIAPWLDGTCDVATATSRAQALRVRVVEPLIAALEEGLLEELAEALPPPLPDDFDTLVELGRTRVREGQLGAAREAFERAVALRPSDRVATQNLRRIVALQGN